MKRFIGVSSMSHENKGVRALPPGTCETGKRFRTPFLVCEDIVRLCKTDCRFSYSANSRLFCKPFVYSAKSLQTRDSLSAKRLVCKISCLFCRLASLMSHQLCCSSICCLWLLLLEHQDLAIGYYRRREPQHTS